MAGTKHFTRMHYHVCRGLREIVAPRQTMSDKEWKEIKARFNNKCSYCGQAANQKNRGIVADHVVPATAYGEFVAGNIIPACQTCNDSRGNKYWRDFITSISPVDIKERIEKIEKYLKEHPYIAPTPETVLTPDELKKYNELQQMWRSINEQAKELYKSKHA